MIMIICEKDEKSNYVCSHGINMDTNEVVIVPQVHPREIGAIFSMQFEEFVLPDTKNIG